MPNTIQTLSFSPLPTAGTYTLTNGSQSTATLNFDDPASTIQAALEALSTIGSGNVSVSGEADTGPITFTFQGALSYIDVPQTTCDASGLGGAGGTIGVVSETTPGALGSATITLSDETTLDGQYFQLIASVSPGVITVPFLYQPSGDNDPANGGDGNIPLTGDTTADAAAVAAFINSDEISSTLVTCSSSGNVVTVTALPTITANDLPLSFAMYSNSGGSGPDISTFSTTAYEAQIIPAPTASGGTFTLTGTAEATSELAWNETVANVNAALNALSDIATALGVVVSGNDGGPWIVTWAEAGPQSLLTVDGSLLTIAVGATASTTQQGFLPVAYGSVLKSAMISYEKVTA